jgi:transglutaminase-like putative cysteine protease
MTASPPRAIATRLRVEHSSCYEYPTPLVKSRHIACLCPRETPRQRLLAHRLEVTPEPTYRSRRTDYFGNVSDFIAVIAPQERFEVLALSDVEIAARPHLPDPDATAPWESLRDALAYRSGARYAEEAEYVFASPHAPLSPALAAYGRRAIRPGRPLLAGVTDLMHAIREDFRYVRDSTDLTTPVTRLLEERKGVCQDFAHLMIACLRSIGLPARYVSGYLLTEPPPGQPRLVGADASHAWVQAYVPEAGWIDFDPTNGVLPDGQHVTLAWGRDYGDVSPLKGVIVGGTGHALSVAVTVTPL